MIRGLVFDFDGLIVDSERPVYRAWAELYSQYGEELSVDLWKTVIGHAPGFFDPVAELEQRLGVGLDAQALRARYRARQLEFMHVEPILPGVREWGEEARAMGVRLGVASNSSRAWVTGNLERLGLAGWHCICCSDDVARPKPAPDVYLAVVECLGVDPRETVAVEDSHSGVRAAKAAGLFCVAVPGSLTPDADYSDADLVLASLADSTFSDVAALAGRGR